MAKKVLVLDHERHMARLVQVNIERAGCAVRTTGDAREALAMAREDCPDLVIVNPLTPGCAEFVDALRTNPLTCNTEVVALPEARLWATPRQ